MFHRSSLWLAVVLSCGLLVGPRLAVAQDASAAAPDGAPDEAAPGDSADSAGSDSAGSDSASSDSASSGDSADPADSDSAGSGDSADSAGSGDSADSDQEPVADAAGGEDAAEGQPADAAAGADTAAASDEPPSEPPADVAGQAPVEETASPVDATESVEVEAPPPSPPDFTGSFGGEYRLRFAYMGDLPLTPFETKGFAPLLGQNTWGSQWLRVGFDLAYRRRLSFVAEVSALDGVVFGDSTNGVLEADRPRDGTTVTRGDAFDLRKAYLQYVASFGAFRIGLQPSHWGLGLLANAGDEAPDFGDYEEGDRDLRLLAATRPLGMEVPFEVIAAADMVYDDTVARLRSGDHAYQGILAVRYKAAEPGVRRELGFYGVYRHQTSPVDGGALPANVPDDTLDVWALDLYANWDFAEPSGGRLFAAFEGAALFGDTTVTRSLAHPKEDLRQFLGAIQLGRRGESLDVTLEGGFASGDSNTEDGVQRRATMSRNHRVGLLLFPEVMAWNTARAASLAASEELGARPSPGSQLLPTNGGVAGAYYFFPRVSYRPASWIDLRAGLVWGRASSAVVDPYRQRAESRAANYQGGDPEQRDLGVELDGAVYLSHELREEVTLTGGVEGAWLRPGRAFDDASGAAMGNVGLVRVRLGLEF